MVPVPGHDFAIFAIAILKNENSALWDPSAATAKPARMKADWSLRRGIAMATFFPRELTS